MIREVLESVNIIALHKKSKLSSLDKASHVIEILTNEVDYELQEVLKIFKHIIERRLNGDSYSLILKDVSTIHPHLIDQANKINSEIDEEKLEEYVYQLNFFFNNKKLEEIVNFLKKELNELELEEFESFTSKLDKVRTIVNKSFESLASIEVTRDESEFIVDSDLDIESQIEDTTEHKTIPTGFRSLDKALYGFQSGRIYVFAGGTGKGKSTLLANFAYNLCTQYKVSEYKQLFEEDFTSYKPAVIFITNENTIAETRKRLVSIITDLPSNDPKLNDKKFQADALKRFHKETGVVFYIKYVTPRSVTAFDIYSQILNLERIRGYKPIGIVVDYLDRLRSLQNTKEERHMLGFITDELKAISIKLNVPVLTATQLNREGHTSEDPSIKNIGESWKKVENADAVIVFNSEQDVNGNWTYKLKIEKLRYKDPVTEPISLIRRSGVLKIEELTSDLENITQKTSQNPLFFEKSFML